MEQVIKGSCLVIVQGESMRPFLRNGDMLVMMPVHFENIRTGDVVIQKINDGYLARRVFKKNKDSVDLGPDSRFERSNVQSEALLGKVIECKRNKNTANCQSPSWVFYTQLALLHHSIAACFRKVYIFISVISRRSCAFIADVLKACLGQKGYFNLRDLMARMIKKLPAGIVEAIKEFLYE